MKLQNVITFSSSEIFDFSIHLYILLVTFLYTGEYRVYRDYTFSISYTPSFYCADTSLLKP